MKATIQLAKLYVYIADKFNKHDTIYRIKTPVHLLGTVLTDHVKIEVFQGYSKAYNLGYYFRIKNTSSWAKSRQITGLFKTGKRGVYYGNIKEGNVRTLLLFHLQNENELLNVYEFPNGFNPSRSVIDLLIEQIQQ